MAPLEGWLHIEWRQLMQKSEDAYRAGLEAERVKHARMVIFGDSHPATALPSTQLPDSIATVAYRGEGLREVELKLRMLLERGIAPKTLIIEADDQVFTLPREASANARLIALVAPTALYNTVYNSRTSSLKKWTLHYLPLTDVRNRNFLFQALIERFKRQRGLEKHNPTRIPDQQTWATLSPEARQAAVARRRLDLIGPTFGISPLMRTSWQRILSLARKHGTRVVAVRYPLSDEYRAEVVRCYDLQPIETLLKELPPDTVLDYTALLAGKAAFFQDADHVNFAGATRVTARLLDDLQSGK